MTGMLVLNVRRVNNDRMYKNSSASRGGQQVIPAVARGVIYGLIDTRNDHRVIVDIIYNKDYRSAKSEWRVKSRTQIKALRLTAVGDVMRMTGGIFWRMFAVVLVSASAEVNAPAEPSAGGGNDVLAEIVVTAQRRFEKLTDAPVSITAAIGDQQHNLGVNSPADVVKLVPGSKPTNDFESSLRQTYGRFAETDAEGFTSGWITSGIDARLTARTEQGRGIGSKVMHPPALPMGMYYATIASRATDTVIRTFGMPVTYDIHFSTGFETMKRVQAS